MRSTEDLLVLWQDQSIGEEDLAELKARLRDADERVKLVDDFLMSAVISETLKIEAAGRASSALRAAPPGPRGRRLRFGVLAAAACLLVTAGAYLVRAAARPSGVPVAEILSVARDVRVNRRDVSLTARAGMALFAGDVVRTDVDAVAAVACREEDAFLRLHGQTELTLKAGEGGKRAAVGKGFVEATVARQPAGRRFVMTTPHAEAEAIGTRFTLSVAPYATRLDVGEGTVRFTRLSDAAATDVSAGQSTAAERRSPLARGLYGFERPEDLGGLLARAEGIDIAMARDEGVTEGEHSARLTVRKGFEWPALELGKEAIRGWEGFDFLVVDVCARGGPPQEILLELSDDRTTDYSTRSTYHRVWARAGRQTLYYPLVGARRNAGRERATRLPEDEIRLDDLKTVKLFTRRQDQDSVFWIDNLRLVAGGVLYRQEFDAPADAAIEPYRSTADGCTVTWAPGGNGTPGTRRPRDGCLRMECVETGRPFASGLAVSFSGRATVIELDCLVEGVEDFVLIAGLKRGGKARQYPPRLQPGKWTHVVAVAEDFSPYGIASREGKEKKRGRGEEYTSLHFGAHSSGAGRHYVLIDNVVVRSALGRPSDRPPE